ncbi:MFS transporter [Mangrovitalea sediminis]|uniref:MFS transporter n=1 Tax=Mangrovitalea sediminis TaxID=1982043 RepID=UPI0018E995C5|nr:MFS transporter [Mangrovitalea sediminis]
MLTICQGLFILSMSIDLTLTGLVGYRLAPDTGLATLPFALITVSTALTTLFASFLIRRIGRRRSFAFGASAGAAGGLISVFAVTGKDFWLFCAGTAIVGVSRAFAQYYRLAAADASDPDRKGKAISTVLAGGVLAALVGPSLAAWSRDLLTDATFAGSYLCVALIGLIATLLLMAAYRDSHDHSILSTSDAAAIQTQEGRPLREILRQPIFIAALANNMIGSAVMIFVMTATPIAVVQHHFSIERGASVIQWHLLGMYAPAFFSGYLIRRIGSGPLLLIGNLLCAACGLIAAAGASLPHFYLALLCLGVGWNFMFTGGSTLLSLSYRPEERAKTQATSEFTTYAVSALASLLAGIALATFGWQAINLAIISALVCSAAATLWWMSESLRRTVPVSSQR